MSSFLSGFSSTFLSTFYVDFFVRSFVDFYVDFFVHFCVQFLSRFNADIYSSFSSTRLFSATLQSKMVVLVVTILLTLKLRIGEGVRLPNYIPTLQVNPAGRNDIVESYFRLGFDYSEILLYLVLFPGISLSLRQLKMVLKSKGLGRRRNSSDFREVCQAVEEELRGSGSNIEYRQMTQRLVNDYGLVVDRETIRELFKILDPDGVELRGKRSLKRRQYRNQGPQFFMAHRRLR